MPRVDKFVDNQKIVEAEELFFRERSVHIGRIDEIILNLFTCASGKGNTTEVKGKKRGVVVVFHLDR